MIKGRSIVLMSGGVDSYACAHFLKKQGNSPTGLFVDYGQAAIRQERAAFESVIKLLRIKRLFASIRLNRRFGAGEIAGRNGLLAMTAVAIAPRHTELIAMGLHAGTEYYDCSPTFIERIDTLLLEYSDGRLRFIAPFATWTKAQIFAYCGKEQLKLSATYSCELGGKRPCGKCKSCLDRAALNAG